MKERKIMKKDTFIDGGYIDQKICKDLIHFFESNPHRHGPGTVGRNDRKEVDSKVKASMDIGVHVQEEFIQPYNKALIKILNKYLKKYPEPDKLYDRFGISNVMNIQKYNKGEGFKKYHCERTNRDSMHRVLVFMTYLNTVKKGGTEFLYQKVKTEAKEGLTLIWPPDFTHTHRGIISDQTKYIITGWLYTSHI